MVAAVRWTIITPKAKCPEKFQADTQVAFAFWRVYFNAMPAEQIFINVSQLPGKKKERHQRSDNHKMKYTAVSLKGGFNEPANSKCHSLIMLGFSS